MYEVALGVQFEDPLPLLVVHYGPLWESFRDRYPELQEQPPLNRVVETFGEEQRPTPQDMINAAVFPQASVRLWFGDSHGGGLVQVQADRFVFNWRKPDLEADYPRFEWVLERFEEEYGRFMNFLAANGITPPKADLCDVTYVNHIPAGEGWDSYADLHALFPGLRVPRLSAGDAVVEEADIRLSYRMTGTDGQAGRLHFRVYPAVRNADQTPLYVVNLVARRRPAVDPAAGVRDALLDGHDWAVLGFRDVTSPEMHAVWGLLDAGD